MSQVVGVETLEQVADSPRLRMARVALLSTETSNGPSLLVFLEFMFTIGL